MSITTYTSAAEAIAAQSAQGGVLVYGGGCVQLLTGADAPADAPLATSITRMQAMLALNQLNLLATVQTAIASAPAAVQIEWANASSFDTSNSDVLTYAQKLGIDVAQVVALGTTL